VNAVMNLRVNFTVTFPGLVNYPRARDAAAINSQYVKLGHTHTHTHTRHRTSPVYFVFQNSPILTYLLPI
jgi:hypothetical protein